MTQPISMPTSTTHALLIGVDDYKSFEASGSSDLKGSLNDVVLLATYCVEVLRVRPENIVALTRPALSEEDLAPYESIRGITRGDADEEDVTKRLAWLLEVSKGGKALLTFSGHGAALPGGEPVLCLGDTAPDFKSGVLPLKTLGEAIKNAYAVGRLVALLDCCHVAAPRPHQRLQGTSLTRSVASEDVMKQEDLFRVSDRVLLAARPGMPAYQARFGKVWHGALTFALVTAADRWKGENEVSHGSYKHVLKRAKGTLKALGVPQKSELRMPAVAREAIRKEPFFGVTKGAFLGMKEGDTVKEPDANFIPLQLDPDFFYTINVGSNVLTQIVATGNSTVVVSINGSQTSLVRQVTENWFVDASFLGTGTGQLGDPNLGEITVVTSETPKTSPTSPLPLDTGVVDEGSCPESMSWVDNLGPPSGTNVTNYVFKGAPNAPADCTLYILFSVTATTTGATTTRALTEVQWYLTDLTEKPSPTSGILNPGSSVPYSRQSDWSPPKCSYWAASSTPVLP